METDYVELKGLYYNSSYKDDKESSKKMLYVFYRAFSNAETIRVSSAASEISFEGTNSYSSKYYKDTRDLMSSYYHSNNIQEVNIGEEKLILATFKVPEAEFTPGKNVTLNLDGIPDSSNLKLKTDDIVKCDSESQIAKKVDMKVYKKFYHELINQKNLRSPELVLEGSGDFS